MESINNSENQDEFLRGTDLEDPVSVDDFIRQLEEKEKDLHIDSDSVIEFEESGEPNDELVLEPPFPTAEPPKQAAKRAAKDESREIEIAGNGHSEPTIAELNSTIRSMEEARKELLIDSQRRIKDFEAFRKRAERERIETFTKQICNLATQMLPVLDNLDRALDFAESVHLESQTEIQPFFEGIVMVNQQIIEVFSGMGIEAILTVGHLFDPHLHEAVAIDENSDLPPHTITEELLRGYKVGAKVIRHSMVKVAKSSANNIKAEPVVADDILSTETAENFDIVETEMPIPQQNLTTRAKGHENVELETDLIELDDFAFETSSGFERERFGEDASGDGGSKILPILD